MELCYTSFDQAVQNLGCACVHAEPMSRHTTFQIGGPADRFVTVETLPQLKGLVKALGESGLPFMILGKGSNLLVSDKGIRGVWCFCPGILNGWSCCPMDWSGPGREPRWRPCALLPETTTLPGWNLPGASLVPREARPIWTPVPMAEKCGTWWSGSAT